MWQISWHEKKHKPLLFWLSQRSCLVDRFWAAWCMKLLLVQNTATYKVNASNWLQMHMACHFWTTENSIACKLSLQIELSKGSTLTFTNQNMEYSMHTILRNRYQIAKSLVSRKWTEFSLHEYHSFKLSLTFRDTYRPDFEVFHPISDLLIFRRWQEFRTAFTQLMEGVE